MWSQSCIGQSCDLAWHNGLCTSLLWLGYNMGTPAGEFDVYHTCTCTHCTHSDTAPTGTDYYHGTPLHWGPIPWGTPVVSVTLSTPHYPPEAPAAQWWAIAHHLTCRSCIGEMWGSEKGYPISLALVVGAEGVELAPKVHSRRQHRHSTYS